MKSAKKKQIRAVKRTQSLGLSSFNYGRQVIKPGPVFVSKSRTSLPAQAGIKRIVRNTRIDVKKKVLIKEIKPVKPVSRIAVKVNKIISKPVKKILNSKIEAKPIKKSITKQIEEIKPVKSFKNKKQFGLKKKFAKSIKHATIKPLAEKIDSIHYPDQSAIERFRQLLAGEIGVQDYYLSPGQSDKNFSTTAIRRNQLSFRILEGAIFKDVSPYLVDLRNLIHEDAGLEFEPDNGDTKVDLAPHFLIRWVDSLVDWWKEEPQIHWLEEHLVLNILALLGLVGLSIWRWIFVPIIKLSVKLFVGIKRFFSNIASNLQHSVSKVGDHVQYAADEMVDTVQVTVENYVDTGLWYRRLANFVFIALLLILPFKAFTYYQKIQLQKSELKEIASGALADLHAAKSSLEALDLDASEQNLLDAQEKFSQVEKATKSYNWALEFVRFLPGQGKQLYSSKYILRAGEKLTSAALIVLPVMKEWDSTSLLIKTEDSEETQIALTDKLNDLEKALTKIQPLIESADKDFSKVYIASFPQEQDQETLTNIKDQLALADDKIDQAIPMIKMMESILGADQFKRYLVMFQNDTEMRGSGGFLGSFAIVDLKDGRIKKIEVPSGGPYAMRAGLLEKVAVPQPLSLLGPNWEMQNANWWPDWPASAQKIQWFYSKSGGSSTDGVIGLTASWTENIIGVLGPISMPEYNKVITKDNFILETEKAVELEYDREANEPKKFIGDLMVKAMDRLLNISRDQMVEILLATSKGIEAKHILFYFSEPEFESKLTDWGIDGAIKPAPIDYLMIANNNIGGGKTDRVIDDTIKHEVQIFDDGSIIDAITLTRNHTGYFTSDEKIFYGMNNVNYLRIYVPLGSELISAEGFIPPPAEKFKTISSELKVDEDLARISSPIVKDPKSQTDIYNEFGKTVFGNWTQTMPFTSTIVKLSYRLPFKVNWKNGDYSLFIQKQPGSKASQFISSIILPDGRVIINQKTSDRELEKHQGGADFVTRLEHDQFYEVEIR